MKKVIKLSIIILSIFLMTGCFKKDELSNNDVYTTTYPITYLANYLYGTEKNINSIYPNGATVTTYELTDKQKENYSKGALFIYNGLTNELETAREFLNKNKKLLLIDVSYGLKIENNIEELWLSPNNFIMLAKNIKNNLIDYTTSKVVSENIENKYKALQENLSYMDADLRNIATVSKASGKNIIVSSSNKLKFLEKYGFSIINLSSDTLSETSIKNAFKNKNYKDIYLCSTDEKSNLIAELESSYGANIINVNMMNTLTDEDANSNKDYITIEKEFIENIRNTALN